MSFNVHMSLLTKTAEVNLAMNMKRYGALSLAVVVVSVFSLTLATSWVIQYFSTSGGDAI